MLTRIASSAALCLILLAGCLYAETEIDYWPEVQFYHHINEQFRIRLAAGITRSQPFAGPSDGFVDADIDIGLKAIVRRKEHPDEHRGKYLSMRLGYTYSDKFSDDDSSVEHRGILEFTGRMPLPEHFLASDRNRIDFRSIGGERSNRYRNRIKLERSSAIGGIELNPYMHAEFFYDSRVDSWNRYEYSIGSEFPIRKRFVLEFYYTYQNNRGSGSIDANGLGTVLQMFW